MLVYGGGSPATADVLVRHIRETLGLDRIDHLVSAHPDAQQTEGLMRLFSELPVGALWMHRPPGPARRDNAANRGLRAAQRLAALAQERGTPMFEPRQGATIGPFYVLSPEASWYHNRLQPDFGAPRPSGWRAWLRPVWRVLRHQGSVLLLSASIEYLPRRDEANAEDEASTVLYGELEGQGLLLTNRAGICAMEASCSYAESLGLRMPRNLRFAQLPFGGADHLSSQVLDRLFGPRGAARLSVRRASALTALRSSIRYEHIVLGSALAARSVTAFTAQGKHLNHSFAFASPPSWRPALGPKRRL